MERGAYHGSWQAEDIPSDAAVADFLLQVPGSLVLISQ